jgi:hypothetical protein
MSGQVFIKGLLLNAAALRGQAEDDLVPFFKGTVTVPKTPPFLFPEAVVRGPGQPMLSSYFRGGEGLYPQRLQDRGALMASTLYWVEKDGKETLLHPHEVLRSPLAPDLPLALLPGGSRLGREAHDESFELLTPISPWGWDPDRQSANRELVRIFCAATELGAPVYLFKKEGETLSLIPVNQVRKDPFLGSKFSASWRSVADGVFETPVLSLVPEIFWPNEYLAWESVALQVKTRDLVFHRAMSKGAHVARGMGLYWNYSEGHRGIDLVGNEAIHRAVSQTELFQSMTGEAPKAASEQIQGEPQFGIDALGNMHFCLYVNNRYVWGFPATLEPILECLANGLRALYQESAPSMASRLDSFKRENDLKLFRHQGVVATIFIETMSYLNSGAFSDKTPANKPKDFRDGLGRRVLRRLFGDPLDVLSYEPELREMLGSNARKAVSKYADLIQEAYVHAQPVYVDGQCWKVQGAGRVFLDLLLSNLYGVLATTPKLLSKSKNAVWEAFCSDIPFQDTVTSHEFHLPVMTTSPGVDWVRLCGALVEGGAKLFYKGKWLENLLPEDFSSTVEMVERSQDSNDWFELNPLFFFKGQPITQAEAAGLSETGLLDFKGRLYRIAEKSLPSLEQLRLFWELVGQRSSKPTFGRGEKHFYRLPKHQSLELLALRASGMKVEGGPQWKALCDFYDSLDAPRTPPPPPDTLKGTLMPYQVRGMQWLLDLHGLQLGGILADDMGLGKTLQSLAYLETLRLRGEMGQVLIVVPTTLVYNWRSEASRFTPDLRVEVFQKGALASADREGQCVWLTTYGLMVEHEEALVEHPWSLVFFDEAQNLKNVSSQRATVARKLKAQRKFCLTGTPMENHYGEYFSLLDLVAPGSMGTWEEFRKRYMNDTMTHEDLSHLKRKARALTLRRNKAELLTQLPAKTQTTIVVPFLDSQLRLYRDVALSWNEKVQLSVGEVGESRSQLAMLTALLRLRQVCSCPSALPGVTFSETPPKISLLVETLVEIVSEGQSALVFTQFVETLSLVEKALKEAKVPTWTIQGSTARKVRENCIREFGSASRGGVLAMTLKTGGVGLNLTKASYVFHLEPWWNPAAEDQATDRTHRMGQTRAVQVYRYIMENSVEEKMEALKDRKRAKFSLLFGAEEAGDSPKASANALTKADFDYLLGI